MKDSRGFGKEVYKGIDGSSEEAGKLAFLKDKFRSNANGTDDNLAIDIQDAIDSDMSLSLVANNILVSVEGEIVTLTGDVYREHEKTAIGDIAAIFSADDNVNNYLRVM